MMRWLLFVVCYLAVFSFSGPKLNGNTVVEVLDDYSSSSNLDNGKYNQYVSYGASEDSRAYVTTSGGELVVDPGGMRSVNYIWNDGQALRSPGDAVEVKVTELFPSAAAAGFHLDPTQSGSTDGFAIRFYQNMSSLDFLFKGPWGDAFPQLKNDPPVISPITLRIQVLSQDSGVMSLRALISSDDFTTTVRDFETSATELYFGIHTYSCCSWTAAFDDLHFITNPNFEQPVITSISPSLMPGLNGNQTLEIYGSDFQSGATLTFDPASGANIESTANKLTFASASKIEYQINNAHDLGLWQVRVNNPDGGLSNWAGFLVVEVPATPGPLEAQAFSDRVELGWTDNSTDETGFKVERKVGSGSWSQIATVSGSLGNSAFYPDDSISPNTTYTYRVRAYNNNGNSLYTNEVQLTTPAGPPGAFTLSNDPPYWDSAGPAVRLTWTDSQGVGGYTLYRNGSIYYSGLSGTSFINEINLNPGQTYTYFVRASNAEGTTDSNTISVTMPTDPGANSDYVLMGFVRDSVTDEGIFNATVTFGSQSTQTTSTGFYAFSDLYGVAASLAVNHEGYEPYTISQNPANNSVRNILLTPDYTPVTGSLSGFVKDKATGTPQSNVTVSLTGGSSAVSDGSGFYSFPTLTPGSYTISVSAANFSNYNDTVSVTGAKSKNILLAKNQSTFGGDNPAPKNADPVNTATGNYFSKYKDLRIPGPGVPFVFERHYNSQDATDGPLGFGWNHSYNVTLSVDGSGNVIVRWGDSREDAYVPDGSGGFTPQYGIFDTLTENPDGSYSLKKKNQTVYNFNLSNRLATIVDKNSNTITLNYTGSNLTSITDSAGRTITFTNDVSGRITLITDPIGRTVLYAYDANGDLITATDPNGNETDYTYDANHQVLTVVDPRGNTLVSNVYDGVKRVVTSQQDAKGGQTTFVYDEVNRKTTVTQPLGRVTVDHFDTLNRLVQREDALGNSTYYAYDEAGNRTVVTDKRGYNTQYQYDERGNVTTKIDPLGNTTTITYDAENRPLSRTDALGNITTFEYDAAGNLIKTTDPLNGETAVTYDAQGLPLTVTDALGRTMTTTYDADGNPASETDALSNTTNYTYDGVGRRLTVTDARTNLTVWIYDDNDNLLSVTDPTGEIRSYTYDGNDNKLTFTDRRSNTWTYAYDVKDLHTTTTDPLTNVTSRGYDALDQRISLTDARSNTVQAVYDTVGNLLTEIDALSEETDHTYDADGNRISTTDPLGNTTQFVYDELARLIQTIDPLGFTTTIDYDALSRRTKTTDANGNSTSLEYDALGRLVKVTDAAGGIVTYAYDAVGNRTSMTEPNGNATTFTYDDLDRLIEKQEPPGGIYQYTYDAVGNRISQTDPNGDTITYTYDVNDRLTDVTYPSGSPVTFAYDENGNRTGMTDSLGNSTFTYDELNRMITSTDAYGKQVGYTYDAVGNRSTMTYPGSKIVTYGYDAVNRMATVTDWLDGTTTYTYDTAGNLVATLNPNGTTAAYTYDAGNRLTDLVNAKPDSSTISSYSLTLDGVGNHLQSDQDEPLDPHFEAEDISYTYDADNRLTSVASVAVGYDNNGNMTSNGTDSYGYDFQNRLTQATIGGSSYQYAYDGVGNRKESISGGQTTRYILDTNGSLSHVLAESDENGAIGTYYIYGRGLIAQINPADTLYYHYDVRGSTIALTNPSADVTDAYAYSPFGTILNEQGTTGNPYKYVGRFGLMNEGNGLEYIRVRYYNSSLGRFITKDSYLGSDTNSQSRHRYVYALNNPIRLVDVSGFSAQEIQQLDPEYETTDAENAELIGSGIIKSAPTGDLSFDVGAVAKGTLKFLFKQSKKLFRLGTEGPTATTKINPVDVVTGMGTKVVEHSPEILESLIDQKTAADLAREDNIKLFKSLGLSYDEALDQYILRYKANSLGAWDDSVFQADWNRIEP
jgi:RHS repeat-associated protein